MRRLLAACLALVLLLFGCGNEIGETAPKEAEASLISVRILEEQDGFSGFTAGPAGERGAEAAELVVEVLALYPEGLLEQLGSVEFLLVGNLTGEDRFAHGGYAGFTQRTEKGWLVVLDAARCDAGTVHHELAHVLDGILTEAGALTEAEWMEFCPDGFRYGEGDWAQHPDFFADLYAMTDIREDRARTFEEAVLTGEGAFDDRPALWLKLECFSRAIRAHFDTEGWPGKTIWELALG